MIFDRIEHAALYRGLGVDISAALDYLRGTDLSGLPDGRYELRGDRLIAIVQRYQTRPPEDARWEAHRRYLDVQYIAEGIERMGCASLHAGLTISRPYDAGLDIEFFETCGSSFEVPAGSFVIFMPQDIHAPGLAAGSPPSPSEVLKVVMKCRIDGR